MNTSNHHNMPLSPSQVQQYSHHQQQGAHTGQSMAPPSPMHHHHSAPAQTSLFPPAFPPQAPEPMEEDDRDAPPVVMLEPENAVRTRCYKLNLDSEHANIISKTQEGIPHLRLGPFDLMPNLTESISEDSSTIVDPTTVAIRTAQIFRGITVSQDGTILSQNARASRSNRGGSKHKRGEKSRQAAKIDKAKDLVEETLLTGKVPGTDDPAKLESLVIMGEYDNMNYLVRDGAKKLRDAEKLTDDALLAINRKRVTANTKLFGPGLPMPQSSGGSNHNPLLSPTRKRVSPHPSHQHQTSAQAPFQSINNSTNIASSANATTSTPSKSSRYKKSSLPQSAPPKLKSHPRDTRPSQRRSPGQFSPIHDPCHAFGAGADQQSVGNDSDWSESLGLSKGLNSLWNCGNDGTVSPTPQQTTKVQQQHERRNDTNTYSSSSQQRVSSSDRRTSRERVAVVAA
mmetsp:Transcript_1314/g.1808  ORF Transcript_1314/g.1808 Transcript_1314/m.1808 type:complete len:455 (-) Transcript_1314:282-1646(-)